MANTDTAAKAVEQFQDLVMQLTPHYNQLTELIEDAKERYATPSKVNKVIKQNIDCYFEAMATQAQTTVKDHAFIRMRNDLFAASKNIRCFDIMYKLLKHPNEDDFYKICNNSFHFMIAINLCRFDDDYIISLTDKLAKLAKTSSEFCEKAAIITTEAIEKLQPENNNINAEAMDKLKVLLKKMYETSESIHNNNESIEPVQGQYYSVCGTKIKDYFFQIFRIHTGLITIKYVFNDLVID